VPPSFVWVPAALVALIMLLPPVYLVVRTARAGGDAWGLIFNASTAEILLRSLVLVVVVTAASATIGVAIAWLSTRTDLPFRKAFTVLTALPLVSPATCSLCLW
jgi:iron(III) transport system permease protein